MEQKRFVKNDNGFICENCGFDVLPLKKTSRNHCPKCLCSLHVDINPGDRACTCLGILRPISVTPDAKKGYIITHKCSKCGHIGRNKAALPDGKGLLPDDQYDDTELLIALTQNRDIILR